MGLCTRAFGWVLQNTAAMQQDSMRFIGKIDVPGSTSRAALRVLQHGLLEQPDIK
jgi:hypothetical protein